MLKEDSKNSTKEEKGDGGGGGRGWGVVEVVGLSNVPCQLGPCGPSPDPPIDMTRD